MRITVRDKSSTVEQTFEVAGGVPVMSLLEELAASLGAVIGPDEVIKPILERTSEALQLGRSLEENGVRDGDVLLLARDSIGGSHSAPWRTPQVHRAAALRLAQSG